MFQVLPPTLEDDYVPLFMVETVRNYAAVAIPLFAEWPVAR